MFSLKNKTIYNIINGFADFPNKYAITIFFSGCNLSCPFCYNRHVITDLPNFSIADVIEKKDRIEKTIGKGNVAMVFSGGEPTIQKNFVEIINIFRQSPLSIHTNGITLPKCLNPFQSVILSLKSSDCGIPKNYKTYFKRALYYYRKSEQKQIQIVKLKKYEGEHLKMLSDLKDVIDKYNWKINFVEKFII